MAWGSSGQVFLGEDLIHTRDYSDETARVIDEEVERILREQEERCRQTLRAHRNGLDLVARALLEHETIDGSEVSRLIAHGDGTPAPTGNGGPRDRVGDRDREGEGIDIGPGRGPDAPAPAPTPTDALTGPRRPLPPPPAPPT
jgi:cell division protease FtsH